MYPAELIDFLIKLAALAVAAGIGSLATWWRIGRRGRADYRRGCTDTERLIRDRTLVDFRDKQAINRFHADLRSQAPR